VRCHPSSPGRARRRLLASRSDGCVIEVASSGIGIGQRNFSANTRSASQRLSSSTSGCRPASGRSPAAPRDATPWRATPLGGEALDRHDARGNLGGGDDGRQIGADQCLRCCHDRVDRMLAVQSKGHSSRADNLAVARCGTLYQPPPSREHASGRPRIILWAAEPPGVAQLTFVLGPADQRHNGRRSLQRQALAPNAGMNRLRADDRVERRKGGAGGKRRIEVLQKKSVRTRSCRAAFRPPPPWLPSPWAPNPWHVRAFGRAQGGKLGGGMAAVAPGALGLAIRTKPGANKGRRFMPEIWQKAPCLSTEKTSL